MKTTVLACIRRTRRVPPHLILRVPLPSDRTKIPVCPGSGIRWPASPLRSPAKIPDSLTNKESGITFQLQDTCKHIALIINKAAYCRKTVPRQLLPLPRSKRVQVNVILSSKDRHSLPRAGLLTYRPNDFSAFPSALALSGIRGSLLLHSGGTVPDLHRLPY